MRRDRVRNEMRKPTHTHTHHGVYYFVPGRDAKHCDQRLSASVRRALCLSANISQKPVRQNFTTFSMHVVCGCGSACGSHRLDMLCTCFTRSIMSDANGMQGLTRCVMSVGDVEVSTATHDTDYTELQ